MRFHQVWGTALGVIALAALSACGGDDGTDGANGTNGATALLKTSAEAAGAYCASGGTRIDSGLDADANGTLDPSEVTGTQYVCNAAAGTALNALTATATEAAGSHCAAGGTRITAGLDTNGNGTLDTAEVSSTAYVCHGATGATGASGANGATGATGATGAPGGTGATGAAGANGYTNLVALATEALGSANCTYGGTRITSGLDTDRNGTLAAGEVTATSYVCNGASVGWTNVTSATSVQMVSHTGYIASNTTSNVTFSLPVAPAVGDVVRIKGGFGAGWTIAQTAGQSIDLGDLRTWSALSGESWTELSATIGANWETTVATSSNGQTVAAVSNSVNIVGISKDGGATWSTMSPAGTGLRIVAVSPDGGTVYATDETPANGMYVSTDDGATWTQRNVLTDVLDFATATNGIVAIGNLGGTVGPYRSTDGGASWTALAPTGAPASACWTSIAVSPDGQHIAVGGDGNGSCPLIPVFVSHDGGGTWVASDTLSGPPQNRHQVVAISAGGSTVVVGSANGGIGLRVSTDGGVTYRQSTVAGGVYPTLTGRIAVSTDGRRMIAAGNNQAYVSNNGGYSWGIHTAARGVYRVAGSGTLDKVYLGTPRGADAGHVFKSESILSTLSGTTSGVGGQVSGTGGDALELQFLGSGTWGLLSGVSNTLVVK